MMKKFFYLMFALSVAIGAGSCKKEAGSQGPMGERGDRGEKGEKGTQGIPGTDGKLIHSGNGVPGGSIGNIGDFYIDKTNAKLYGPKASGGWGTATDMRGATGATGATGNKGDAGSRGAAGVKGDAGAAGSQFLSGTSAPAVGVGKAGDFYFRTTTGELFGPKNANNTWSGGVSLKGAKGDKGDKGDTGVKGDKGDAGNANVKVYTQDIKNATWETVGTAADGYQKLVINAPNVLDLATVREAVILVYVRSSDYAPNYWALVPYYTHRNVRVDALVDHRNLTLKKDQDGKPNVPTIFYEVKIVVIKRSSRTEPISRIKNAPVDFKNYDAVMEHFNFKD